MTKFNGKIVCSHVKKPAYTRKFVFYLVSSGVPTVMGRARDTMRRRMKGKKIERGKRARWKSIAIERTTKGGGGGGGGRRWGGRWSWVTQRGKRIIRNSKERIKWIKKNEAGQKNRNCFLKTCDRLTFILNQSAILHPNQVSCHFLAIFF